MDALFPKHGWAKNGRGGAIRLWLPIFRLYQPKEPFAQRFYSAKKGGTWLQSRSPYRTIRQLAIALRDMHNDVVRVEVLSQGNWFHKEPSAERDSAMNEIMEKNERIEVLLISVFVLLRRLADELIVTTGILLFKKPGTVPQELKEIVKLAAKDRLPELNPGCDLAILKDALINHTQWFQSLRQGDGIRDILVHFPHVLQVGAQGTKAEADPDFKYEVHAVLAIFNARGGMRTKLIFPELIDCISGACGFMERLYLSVAKGGVYESGDSLNLSGSTGYIAAYWPPIESA